MSTFKAKSTLLKIFGLWKEALDQGKSADAIFKDLDKAFDNLNHGLLIAKLEAYRSPKNFVIYIERYLDNQLQTTTVNNDFSLCRDTLLLLLRDQYTRSPSYYFISRYL